MEEACYHFTNLPALKCIIADTCIEVKNTPSQTVLLSIVISFAGIDPVLYIRH